MSFKKQTTFFDYQLIVSDYFSLPVKVGQGYFNHQRAPTVRNSFTLDFTTAAEKLIQDVLSSVSAEGTRSPATTRTLLADEEYVNI